VLFHKENANPTLVGLPIPFCVTLVNSPCLSWNVPKSFLLLVKEVVPTLLKPLTVGFFHSLNRVFPVLDRLIVSCQQLVYPGASFGLHSGYTTLVPLYVTVLQFLLASL